MTGNRLKLKVIGLFTALVTAAAFAGCGSATPADSSGMPAVPSVESGGGEEWQTYSDEDEVSSVSVLVNFSFEDNFDDKTPDPAWYGATRENTDGAAAPDGMKGGCAALTYNKSIVLKNIEGADEWRDYTVEADVMYWASQEEFRYYGGHTGILARCNGNHVDGYNEKHEQNRFISFGIGEIGRKLVDKGSWGKIPLSGRPVFTFRITPNIGSSTDYDQVAYLEAPELDLTRPHRLKMTVKGDSMAFYCDGKEIKFEGDGYTGIKVEIPPDCEKGRVGAYAYSAGGKIDNFRVSGIT